MLPSFCYDLNHPHVFLCQSLPVEQGAASLPEGSQEAMRLCVQAQFPPPPHSCSPPLSRALPGTQGTAFQLGQCFVALGHCIVSSSHPGWLFKVLSETRVGICGFMWCEKHTGCVHLKNQNTWGGSCRRKGGTI